MYTSKLFLPFLLVLLLLQAPLALADTKKREVIHIRSGERVISLNVELASTEEEIRKGLMFRRSLEKDSGMLFVFSKEMEAYFWMKNTFISLDILFIDKGGTIINIVESTVPLSTDLIPSKGNITGVLEIAGGNAAKLRIAKGDKVIYPHFHE